MRESKTEIMNILKNFSDKHNYFTLNQIRKRLASSELRYSDITIKKYLELLKSQKQIFSAGRGCYSTITNKLILDDEELLNLGKLLKEKFPFLEYSLWSTKSINFAFHHLQNKFFTFIYSDKDALIYLRDFLIEQNFSVYLNPSKSDFEKNLVLKDGSIILRSSITRSKNVNFISSIEKVLVDLYLEKDRLSLMDESEYGRVFENIVTSYRVDLTGLLDYAERRKILSKMKILITKYTNATFD